MERYSAEDIRRVLRDPDAMAAFAEYAARREIPQDPSCHDHTDRSSMYPVRLRTFEAAPHLG